VSDKSKVSHTAGPWHLDDHTIYGGPDEQSIAELCNRRHQSMEPNGRLIAAAPELLAAVGSALWVFNNLHNVTKDPEQFIKLAEAAAADCRRAYRQAEGRQGC
jgi:hypothetical protein